MVIGASFIGLEVAASLRSAASTVHVVARRAPAAGEGARPRARRSSSAPATRSTASSSTSAARRAAIEDRAVVLDDGARLAADLVVIGVGVRPRTALAEAAGLTIDNGVLVDAWLETSAPGIFAAGDIARFPYPLAGGGAVRIEHWVVAERQGQLAARNMLGAGRRYDARPLLLEPALRPRDRLRRPRRSLGRHRDRR